MEVDDYALALSLQLQFNEENVQNKFKSSSSTVATSSKKNNIHSKKGIVDPEWELLDPNPNIHTLFLEFNKMFFWGKLDMVEVKWSPRMTLCAGICSYQGKFGLCSVRLSKPLLSLRPRKDLVETLLHEMIHAYLFVTDNNTDHDGHGPQFCSHMNRINAETGTNISIYHNFHDEVNEMRKHWWRCTGRCRTRPPYFGYVKRAMNRAPSPRDFWWPTHQASCDGVYEKVKEPEGFGQKKTKKAVAAPTSQPKLPASPFDIKPSQSRKTPFSSQPGTSSTSSSSTSKPPSSSFTKNPPKTPKPTFFHAKSGSTEKKPTPNFATPPWRGATPRRGIPLSSRIFDKFPGKINPQNLPNKLQKTSRNVGELASLLHHYRRTGQRSVNTGAAAFKHIPVVTKFLTAGEKRRRIRFPETPSSLAAPERGVKRKSDESAVSGVKRKPQRELAVKNSTDGDFNAKFDSPFGKARFSEGGTNTKHISPHKNLKSPGFSKTSPGRTGLDAGGTNTKQSPLRNPSKSPGFSKNSKPPFSKTRFDQKDTNSNRSPSKNSLIGAKSTSFSPHSNKTTNSIGENSSSDKSRVSSANARLFESFLSSKNDDESSSDEDDVVLCDIPPTLETPVSNDPVEATSAQGKVPCPVCGSLMPPNEINVHLDRCLDL